METAKKKWLLQTKGSDKTSGSIFVSGEERIVEIGRFRTKQLPTVKR